MDGTKRTQQTRIAMRSRSVRVQGKGRRSVEPTAPQSRIWEETTANGCPTRECSCGRARMDAKRGKEALILLQPPMMELAKDPGAGRSWKFLRRSPCRSQWPSGGRPGLIALLG